MIESTTDCGHLCCPERQMPFHDHFLSSEQCSTCAVHRARLAYIEAGAADLRQKLAAAQPPGLPADVCSQCQAEKPDAVGLTVMDVAPCMEAEDFGFCSIPCLVIFVQKHYSGLVPATPAEAPGPPSGRVSAGIGGDPAAVRGSAVTGSSPTSEAGA